MAKRPFLLRKMGNVAQSGSRELLSKGIKPAGPEFMKKQAKESYKRVDMARRNKLKEGVKPVKSRALQNIGKGIMESRKRR